MSDLRTDESRISELLWRTVKLRASLLTVSIVILLIVWSAVLSGDQRAKTVDVAYCQKLEATAEASMASTGTKPATVGPAIDDTFTCSEARAHSYLEAARAFNAFLLPNGLANSSEAARKSYFDMQAFFSEYDSKRRSSYDFRFQLSSDISSGEMFANGLTVAEIIPFVILLVSAVVIILGFQQEAYKARLIAFTHGGGSETALALARTQFFTFSTFAARQNARRVKWPVLSAERLIIWGLASGVAITAFGVLSAFAENVIHLTDSILFSYTSNLYGFAFLLGFWLVYTRRLYRETLEFRVGGTETESSRPSFRPAAELCLVAAALASLMLPWASPSGALPSLRGYFFVFRQQAKPGFGGVGIFAVDPRLFSELQWQLAIALAFVLLCGVEVFLGRVPEPVRRWVHALRAMLAVLTLFYALNLLLYMGILEYEAIRGTSWGMQNMIFGSLAGRGIGLPLDIYDPSYGFFLFLAASFGLIWLSIRDASGARRLRA
jgi:hypothetical protein